MQIQLNAENKPGKIKYMLHFGSLRHYIYCLHRFKELRNTEHRAKIDTKN